MSVVYVNGSNGSSLDRNAKYPTNEDETDSALGSSHSNSTHSPDMTGERDVIVNGEEHFEDYGVAEEPDPEAFNPFGDIKKSLSNQLNGLGGTFNRTASVRRSFRRPSPASVRRTPSFGVSSSSLKGSPGAHPRNGALHDGADPDADQDDWNSVDSFQRDDDVYLLTQQMEKMQNQLAAGLQSRADQEENISKLRQDNAGMTERCSLLEEQLKDQEVKYEERLREEHRKNMDLLQRLERDKTNELENRNTRITVLETELSQLRNDTLLLNTQMEKFRLEKSHYFDRLGEAERQVSELTEENNRLKESLRRERDEAAKNAAIHDQELAEVQHEVDGLRTYKIEHERYAVSHSRVAPERVRDLEQELQRVKQENVKLEESNQELNTFIVSNHIQEGQAMLRNDMGSLFSEFTDSSKDEMLSALKEQQEVNRKLKDYVDKMLVDVLERAPHLLEVRLRRFPPSSSSQQQQAYGGSQPQPLPEISIPKCDQLPA
ncbi:putative Rab11 family-interacting protein 3 [Hypsibius exemplaris]|uniref:Rab11 family-interacting protein 3 n=1 Tax=Hypsibius exemplaris TaxID=2072580 RepID=A0A1W0XE87_HYPEX|nr:putative Rab11 family-interacting protein 3 [Hypsibius exemplaris]